MRFLVVVALALGACDSSAPPVPLTVSWRFADGRACEDTGVYSVELTAGTVDKSFPCAAGAAPATVTLDAVTPGAAVVARALSPMMTELYRAETSADVLESPLELTLYATGAN